MPRPLRIALGVAATGATASVVVAAINSDWTTAAWALTAAIALVSLVLHSCPRPAPAERGLVALTFVGGPLDGADIPLPGAPTVELLGVDLSVSGTRYQVTAVEHTCYTVAVSR